MSSAAKDTVSAEHSESGELLLGIDLGLFGSDPRATSIPSGTPGVYARADVFAITRSNVSSIVKSLPPVLSRQHILNVIGLPGQRLDIGPQFMIMRTRNRLINRPDQTVVVADSGSENVNRAVDDVLDSEEFRRVLAQVEVTFSNSMIEAFWRSLKHSWRGKIPAVS